MDLRPSAKDQTSDKTYETYEHSPEQGHADVELSTVNVNVYESMRIDANNDEHTYGVANVAADKVRTSPEVTLSRTALIVLVVSAVILSVLISTVSAVVVYNVISGKMEKESLVKTRRLESLDSAIQAVQQNQTTSDMTSHERYTLTDQRLDMLEAFVHDPVLFTARLSSSLNPRIGATIIFPNIVQNIGNGYNASTGMFTAPINGTYLFSAQMCINANTVISYAVMANERQLSLAEHGDDIDDVCSSTTAVGVLAEGDTVYVRCIDTDLHLLQLYVLEANDHGRFWTMFTGVLINTAF